MIRLVLGALGCLLLLLPVGAGCGRKGPPTWTAGPFPLRVEHLAAVGSGGRAVLKGEIVVPEGQDPMLNDISAIRLYHTWYPEEAPPCEGCPIDYPGYEMHPLRALDGRTFSLEVSLKQKALHYFEVRLVGTGGQIGLPSNRAKVLIE